GPTLSLSSLVERSPALSSPLRVSSFFNHAVYSRLSTLSLHDALPISSDTNNGRSRRPAAQGGGRHTPADRRGRANRRRLDRGLRSEEHTSELQSRFDLVCRLLLEKQNKNVVASDTCCG